MYGHGSDNAIRPSEYMSLDIVSVCYDIFILVRRVFDVLESQVLEILVYLWI